MDYLVKGNELLVLDQNICAQYEKWSAALKSLKDPTDKLANTDNLEGNTADNMKNYLTCVYTSIQAMFDTVFADYTANWSAYFGDHANVDSDANRVIDTDELKRIDKSQKKERDAKGIVEAEVYAAINSVSDLTSATFRGLGYIQSAHDKLNRELTDLGTEITDLETAHENNDFSEIDSTLADLKSMLNEMLGHDMIYKLNFDVAAFAASESYQKLVAHYDKLVEDVNSKSEKIQAASEARKQQVDQLIKEAEEEAKKREQQAALVKGITLVTCIVVGTVATVATAGAASPILVGAISGAVTGGVLAGVNTGADMYAAGGWDNMDWGKIGTEALIGAVKGGVTGALSGAIAVKTQGLEKALIGKLPEGSPAIMGKVAKYGSKTIVSTVNKVTTSATDRFLDSSLHGEGFGQALKETFDPKAIGKDFIAGSTKGFTSAVISDGLSGLDGKYTGTNKIIEKGFTGAVSEAGGGAVSRFTSTLYDTGSWEKATKATTDKNSIIGDLAAGGSSGAAKEYVDQHSVYQGVPKEKDIDKAHDQAMEDAKNYNEKYGKNAVKFIEERTGVTGVEQTGESKNLDYSKSGQIPEVNGQTATVRIKMSGNESTDLTNATTEFADKINQPGWEPDDNYVWHHSGDVYIDKETGEAYTEMQLVPDDVHNYYYKHMGTNKQYEHYNEHLQTNYKDNLKVSVDVNKKAITGNKSYGAESNPVLHEFPEYDAPSITISMPV